MSIDVPALLDRVTLPMGQHPREIVDFCNFVLERGRPKRILEIGAGHGGTTELFGHLASDLIISVDLPSGATSGLNHEDCRRRNQYLHDIHPHFRGILGHSTDPDTVLAVAEILGEQCLDVLFIDGDHHELAVRRDMEIYLPFVKRGGVIAFHDINSDKYEFDGVEVHLFWRKMRHAVGRTGGDYWEFSIKAEWGGIGAVVR